MDAIISRIQKLLALSESSNENEAALAAEKAQEMMLRHGIEEATVAAAGRTSIGIGEASVRGRLDPWRRQLAAVIARAMGGRLVYENDYHKPTGKLEFFGPAGSVAGMVELYSFLEARLVTISALATAAREETYVHGKSYRASFLMGAVSRIGGRLNERKKRMAEAEADTSKALVVIKSAVDSYVEDKYPNLRRSQAASMNSYEGYAAGRKAGDNVPLGGKGVGGGGGQLPPA